MSIYFMYNRGKRSIRMIHMNEVTTYRFKDVMDEHFPFKMEIRGYEEFNIRAHAHEHLQLCYIRKGSCTHFINDKQATLVKGDMYFVPPFRKHTNIPIKDSDVEMVQIDFMPWFINDNMVDLSDLSNMEGFIDFAYIQPFVSVDNELLPKLNISSSNQMLIEQLLDSMYRELEFKEQGYRLSVKADLLKLLVIVGREYADFLAGRQEKMIIGNHRRAFFESLQYLKEHFCEENRLEYIASKAVMSPTYFSYVFKLMTGKTYIEYLNELRINEAMNQLKNTDKSITEICLSVGFNHLGHFTRMFRKRTGVTPSQYRK